MVSQSVRWSGLSRQSATVTLAAALLSETVQAQDVDGWYAGAGAGTSHVEVFRGTSAGFGEWEAGPSDGATLVFGGYRVNDHLAFDVTYIPQRDLEWREEGVLASGLPGYYDSRTVLSTSALQVSALGILPFEDIWEAYLRGGVSRYRAGAAQRVTDHFSGEERVQSRDMSDAGLLLGLGIGVALSQNWRVRLEYQFAWIDHALIDVEEEGDPTVDTWFLGFDYRFGSNGRR